MFSNSGLSNENYSRLIQGWAAGPHISLQTRNIHIQLGAPQMNYYSSVAASRAQLVADGWIITDGGEVASIVPTVSIAPTASQLISGQSLGSSTLTGGSVSVPGVFSFANPQTILSNGTNSVAVLFTPTNLIVNTPTQLSINVTVDAPATDRLSNTGLNLSGQMELSWLAIALGLVLLGISRAMRRNALHQKWGS
jgi:hypothetical protein